ncbi:hypothetical protein PTE30175_00553 [Pandoraea terrae]|uniref:Uncharacterized protein n=1 Tax=Pandoraea terrae TaxID=1537710 RepID=A0A5E4S6L7_9BURK|nr:hypothetical protein PTE30175_00553 [Pandoraea terrae]
MGRDFQQSRSADQANRRFPCLALPITKLPAQLNMCDVILESVLTAQCAQSGDCARHKYVTDASPPHALDLH